MYNYTWYMCILIDQDKRNKPVLQTNTQHGETQRLAIVAVIQLQGLPVGDFL